MFNDKDSEMIWEAYSVKPQTEKQKNTKEKKEIKQSMKESVDEPVTLSSKALFVLQKHGIKAPAKTTKSQLKTLTAKLDPAEMEQAAQEILA